MKENSELWKRRLNRFKERLHASEKEMGEKTMEKTVCPKCEKECPKRLKEVSAALFKNEGFCMNCLPREDLAKLNLALEVQKELMRIDKDTPSEKGKKG